MILADKIIKLRKQQGWSQEQLAEMLNVSRQSVSKWEGGLSIPDLDKIIKMSSLFGVSTDYLLKDELEEIQPATTEKGGADGLVISMEEAARFMEIKEELSSKSALLYSMQSRYPENLTNPCMSSDLKTPPIVVWPSLISFSVNAYPPA